ncbi:ABC transporter substrate-binding protein [Nesterenkonia aerolata]|uniref:ABC transporter substrate-binding protein n=1 Tax=Nesterenkonia aerolata TaxID=3074079 RepID=A0ABU2DTS8_9MICC|nr:ABC transporter substrate-binding protein [Nesterenkonia sp. LY-0111]MDR8019806.1 ABC transporter substrate-binding protein [Nesterenkonia sp. LY-0111]
METGASAEVDESVEPSGQAPELEELLDSGDLPALAERIPEDPPVIKGPDGPGEYGGEMVAAMLDNDDDSTIRRYVGYEPLVRWNADWTDELVPGLARDWESSEDGTTYTLHLQEGVRWSDGESFTADDLVFGYRDVISHEELTPGPNEYLVDPQGELGEIEKIDDYTVEITFQNPHGMFLTQMARADDDGMFHRFPRHYLEQFHADFAEDLDEVLEEEGYDEWTELFHEKGGVTLGTGFDSRWMNTELPTLNPWVIDNPAYTGTRVTAERNPYYWKVDEDGNQLPYVDRMVFDVYSDLEALAFRAASGDISFQDRHLDHDFRPLLAESMEENGFSLVDVTTTDMNVMVLNLNLHHEDEDIREIFNEKDFRIGLSHALNREEIIELNYHGQGEAAQAAPREDSPFYHEELATQYTEYDVDLANEYLDRVLPETDDQGRRLGSDGEPFTFEVDVASDRSVEIISALEIAQQHWAEVGVTVEINTMDRDLRNERRDNNSFDANSRDGSAGLQDSILRPRWYMPHGDSSNYAPMWGEYYLDEDNGFAPPEDSLAWDQWEIYDQILAEPDDERRAELMEELLDLSAEAFWTIGLATSANRAGVISDDLRNAPYELYESSAFENPGPAHPESFWWVDPDDAVARDEEEVQEEVDEVDEEDIETEEEADGDEGP